MCLLCLCARLFICALWSPAGKGIAHKKARLQIYFSVEKGSWVSPRIILKEDSHIGHVLIEKYGLY